MTSTNNQENEARPGPVQTREHPKVETILDFCSEIRLTIFKHANQGSFEVHKDTAILLSALSNHPRLHEEAKEVYNNLFYSVNHENEETFKKLKRVEKLRITHLEVIAPLQFRAQPIVMLNNIECLTLDYSNEEPQDDLTMVALKFRKMSPEFPYLVPHPGQIAKDIIRGSKQVKRIVLKMREGARNDRPRVNWFSAQLGVDVKERGVLAGGVVYWVWETKGENAFSWPI